MIGLEVIELEIIGLEMIGFRNNRIIHDPIRNNSKPKYKKKTHLLQKQFFYMENRILTINKCKYLVLIKFISDMCIQI